MLALLAQPFWARQTAVCLSLQNQETKWLSPGAVMAEGHAGTMEGDPSVGQLGARNQDRRVAAHIQWHGKHEKKHSLTG